MLWRRFFKSIARLRGAPAAFVQIQVLIVVLAVFLQPVAAWAAPQEAAPEFAQRVLDLTNARRAEAGLAPLRLNAQLSQAAQSYSEVLASSDCFAHSCGSVPEVANRVEGAGYGNWRSIGENIAAGYSTPEDVVEGWMNSPGHRKNILSPNYAEIGIGFVAGRGAYGTYWTQDFGAREASAADGDMTMAAVDGD
jgi:uncharacterized protein YkwD